jgi:hypothetical protein
MGHERGSSMTVMYADMSDDEVIETAQAVTFGQIEKVLKSEQWRFLSTNFNGKIDAGNPRKLLWRRCMGIEPT